jgi:hypothetical protein
MDLNDDPDKNVVLRRFLESGKWRDVGAVWAQGGDPRPTYRKDGPYEGMSRDESATRIDVILLNEPAWSALERFRLVYDLGIPGHVGLECVFGIPKFKTSAVFLKRVGVASVLEMKSLADEDERQTYWTKTIDNARLEESNEDIKKGDAKNAYGRLSKAGVCIVSALFSEGSAKKAKHFKRKGETAVFEKNGQSQPPPLRTMADQR